MFATSCGDTRHSASETGGGWVPMMVTASAPTTKMRTRVPSAIAAAAATGGELVLRAVRVAISDGSPNPALATLACQGQGPGAWMRTGLHVVQNRERVAAEDS